MRINNKSGFTLLEVIIVIIIIAILASVALPKLGAVQDYAKAKEALGAIPLIRQEMDMCYNSKSTQTYVNCTTSVNLVNPKHFAAAPTLTTAADSYAIQFNGAGTLNAADTIKWDSSTGNYTTTGKFANMRLN